MALCISTLAIRSGYYEKMNYAVVYEDELKKYNPITGEIDFVTDFSECTQRDAGDESKVVGYYAWFRLETGAILVINPLIILYGSLHID